MIIFFKLSQIASARKLKLKENKSEITNTFILTTQYKKFDFSASQSKYEMVAIIFEILLTKQFSFPSYCLRQ